VSANCLDDRRLTPESRFQHPHLTRFSAADPVEIGWNPAFHAHPLL